MKRHVRCLSDMPERTREFVRTPHVENKRGVIPLKPYRKYCWLNPRRGHRRVAKPARQQLHGVIQPRRDCPNETATASRAAGFSAMATASSTSRITASASSDSAFSARRAWLPGANRKLRSGCLSLVIVTFPIAKLPCRIPPGRAAEGKTGPVSPVRVAVSCGTQS